MSTPARSICIAVVWRSTGKTPEITLEELRQRRGVGDGKYVRMHHFKAKVLYFAIKQMNENTDITARDPNTIDLLSGIMDTGKARPKRKRITRAEAEGMAKPGEGWPELLKRLSSEFLVTGMN